MEIVSSIFKIILLIIGMFYVVGIIFMVFELHNCYQDDDYIYGPYDKCQEDKECRKDE